MYRSKNTFPTSFVSPGSSDNHVNNSSATLFVLCYKKKKKKKNCVLIFLVHKSAVLTQINFYIFPTD